MFRLCAKLIVISLMFISPSVFGASVHGVFQVVKGDVKIKSGKTGESKRARIGQKVYPKDTITTQENSRAKIIMVDKNVINVSPKSKMEIKNYEFDNSKGKKNVLLNILYGKIRSKVKQKYDGKKNTFRVKTPTAVAGVRGTDFLAGYSPSTNSTKCVTFEGKVVFGTPGRGGKIENAVEVKVGQLSMNVKGEAPAQPVKLPPKVLAKFDNDSNVELPGGKDDKGRRQPANDDDEDRDENDAENDDDIENDQDQDQDQDLEPDEGQDQDGDQEQDSEDGAERDPDDTSKDGDANNEDSNIAADDMPPPPPPSDADEIQIGEVDALPLLPPPLPLPPTIEPCDFCTETITGGAGSININVNF